MIVDLRQFDDFPAQAVIEASDGEIQPLDDLITRVGKVTLRLSLQKAETEYFCQGLVTAEVQVQCSRCAREVELELEGSTDFIIRTQAAEETDGSDASDDEDYVYAAGKDETADVTDLVRQALVLALPMKPLCSEDCKGLCPVCRTNWNERACSCAQEQTDPRWDSLRNLLNK